MNDEEQTVRDTYFVEARLHWDKHFHDSEHKPPDAANRYVHLDGGQDSRGVRRKAIWPSIIKFARSHDIDPCLLISAVFANNHDSKLPLASMFISRGALDAYSYYKSERALDVEYDFKSFRKAAASRYWEIEQTMTIPPNIIWRLVIVDPLINHGSLYRYCLAIELNQDDLALRYRHSALMEYITSIDEFDKVLGKYIPEEFKAVGRQLREKFKHG